MEELFNRLNSICQDGVIRNKPLAELTTWQIGGPADFLVMPSGVSEIQTLLPMLHNQKVPFIVIGAGSNILFSDSGFRGVVIKIGERLAKYQVDGQHVKAQAGAWTPCFSRKVAQSNLKGAEHLIGIPGNIGGLICMNGGSQRQSISDNVTRVVSVNLDGQLIERKKNDCEFGYRNSFFQKSHEIIVEAQFEFQSGNYRDSRKDMLEIMTARNKKFPIKSNSCGSVFLSSPIIFEQYGSPGRIIEELGLKGKRIGAVKISQKHANFIVNEGNGKADEVLALVRHIREKVEKVYKVSLECEALYVTQNGQVLPLHLVESKRNE